jgi:predicted nucleotide-binding protein
MKKKPTCFVIAPFDASGRRVQETIRHTLEAQGFRVVSPDLMPAATHVMSAITEAITEADFLVVDITRQNPNVMYELGLAHGMRKPTILIQSTEGTTSFPSDLAGWLYVSYDPSNFRQFTDYLSHAVHRFKSESQS